MRGVVTVALTGALLLIPNTVQFTVTVTITVTVKVPVTVSVTVTVSVPNQQQQLSQLPHRKQSQSLQVTVTVSVTVTVKVPVTVYVTDTVTDTVSFSIQQPIQPIAQIPYSSSDRSARSVIRNSLCNINSKSSCNCFCKSYCICFESVTATITAHSPETVAESFTAE